MRSTGRTAKFNLNAWKVIGVWALLWGERKITSRYFQPSPHPLPEGEDFGTKLPLDDPAKQRAMFEFVRAPVPRTTLGLLADHSLIVGKISGRIELFFGGMRME